MFLDEVKITVQAGKGGDGKISFHRTKYVPKGGPNGGDGGKGGDVVFVGTPHLNTLGEFRSKKLLKAENGNGGDKNNKAGRYGEDLVIEVPLGTKITDAKTGQELFDLTDPAMRAVVAHGGRGGYGNAHFTASTRQAPRFAEKGEPGEEMELKLELQMIADVALVGFPSVGKSTLISVISAAKPKIGAYPFTTLVPNLGVVKMKQFGGSPQQDFVVADVPGLIEGAHEGKGLGDQFLRHIKRTAAILHLIDISRETFVEDYQVINQELMKFDPRLLERKQLVVLTKIDMLTEEELAERREQFLAAYPFLQDQLYEISALNKAGLKELMFAAAALMQEVREAEAEGDFAEARDQGEEVAFKVFRPHLNDPQRVDVELLDTVEREDRYSGEIVERQRFKITGQRFEQIVVMTDMQNEQAVGRVYDVIKKKGVDKKLLAAGAKPGDIMVIGEKELEFLG